MLKTVHDPWETSLFHKGANTDVDPERVANTPGLYHDAQNMRPVSVDGNTGSIEKIRGEQLRHEADFPNPDNYICIGVCEAGGKQVTFWASNLLTPDPPLVKIDGYVHAASDGIPFLFNKPLQIAVRNDCKGGVVYTADDNGPLLFWDIQAMIDALDDGTGIFFGSFNIDTITVGLMAPANFPIHIGNPLVGVGMPVGQYCYALRYVDAFGNRTNIGLETPLISVPLANELNHFPTSSWPGMRTYGGPTSIVPPSPWGIALEFRIDNYAGYDSIEIIRHQHNDGSGLTGAGETRIIGRIQLTTDQFTIHQFVDPVDSNVNELIPADEAAIQQLLINAPKCVEYMDQRIVIANFQTESRVAGVEFQQVDGQAMVGITKKLVTGPPMQEVPDGYTNQVHNTYRKSYVRGEKYGFAFQPWDGVLGKAPAIPILGATNFQFPNRRDVKANSSLVYSDDPCYAANVNVQSADPVGPTFEAFTQGEKRKTDFNSVVNHSYPGDVWRPASTFGQFDPNPPNNGAITVGIENVFGVPTPVVKFASYQPWHPTGNADTLQTGYNIPPNTLVNFGPAGQFFPQPVAGQVFAPTVQALGGLLGGPVPSSIPAWVRAFTIPRTKPAGRVICQGIGTYVIQEQPIDAPATKYTNGLRCHFPDISAGMVPQAIVDDFKANPQNYRLQFVSPLGFNTETYNHLGEFPGSGWPGTLMMKAKNLDIITHARILHDEGQVNAMDLFPMGYHPAGGSGVPDGNYVGHDKWRSDATMQGNTGLPNYSFWQESPDQGNALLQVSAVQEIVEGRNTIFGILTDQYIYTPEGNTVGFTTEFLNQIVRTFHQPVHVINLIQIGAEVDNDNITGYINTGCHIKTDACVGITSGGTNEDFRLVDERWEDCINFLGTEFRYAYVRAPGMPEETYLCITGNTVISLPVVLAAIAGGGYVAPDGTVVKGVYQAVQDSQQRWLLRFGIYGIIPPNGSRIHVKYSGAPIRVFGGDSTIASSIHAVYDRFGSEGDPGDVLMTRGLPLPYTGYQINPRYLMPREGANTEQVIHVEYAESIRQWCVLFDCETRVPLAMSLNLPADGVSSPYQYQWYPAIHYINRPNANLNFTSGTASGFQPGYDIDYPGEAPFGSFNMGGFRFKQTHNLDYSKQRDITFLSVPAIGYRERTDFCNAFAWTPKTSPTQQDQPGLRTFTTANLYPISEETGEVKLIAAMKDGIGQNLKAWTNSGTLALLTNKNILTGAAGETIATQASDLFIGPNAEKWISRYVGMPEEMWQLAARGQVPYGSQEAETMFWADTNSVYRMVGDTIDDLARGRYLKGMLPFLFAPSRMAAMWNAEHNEYWMQIKYFPNPIDPQESIFVFSADPKVNNWVGRFTHSFDRYLCMGQQTFGMRQQRTFELDKGFVINGVTIPAFVQTPLAPLPGMKKEAVRFRVRSLGSMNGTYVPPTAIEYLDATLAVATHQDQATGGVYWIKNIDGFEQWIDRTLASYDPARKRLQSELFYQRILHEAQEDFKITLSMTQIHQIV